MDVPFKIHQAIFPTPRHRRCQLLSTNSSCRKHSRNRLLACRTKSRLANVNNKRGFIPPLGYLTHTH